MTDKPTPSSAAEFALQALVAAGHVSQELVDRALALPGAPQPAHSGEPVAWRYRMSGDMQWQYTERKEQFSHASEVEALTNMQPVEREPLTPREIELIDGMIAVQLDHAMRCDAIANRAMADKQKGWDMERVALLQKFKAAHGSQGGQHGAE